MLGIQLPKTRLFIENSHCSSQSLSTHDCTVMRTGQRVPRVRCKRNQQILFAAQWGGQDGRTMHSGQWRAGSRGIGRPSRAQLVDNT
jgi:hypothetical protein